jgi:DNA polymerase-3 subunit gamma/tau
MSEEIYKIYARKYRPKTFEELIGQKAVVQTLQNAVKNNRVAQAYIFSGMRGVGKTTAARILAKALNCQHGPTPVPCNNCEFCKSIDDDRSIDVLEIDGASNRGIDDVRTLRETVKYKPIQSRHKVIIIDEVHMLSKEAFNALLKTLEEPPLGTVFIFATTEFHKVPATIISRCQHFEFKKIAQKDIINHLLDITKKESITISSSGLNLIAEAADGSLRDAESLLDQAVAFCGENISDEDLKEILGTISRELLLEFSSAILEEKPDRIFALVDRIIESGYDLRFFYKEIVQHFRDMLLIKTVEKAADLLPYNPEELESLGREAKKASAEEILRYLLALQQGEAGLRYTSHPQIYLEILLIKLCHFKKLVHLKDILQEIDNLKKEVPDGSTPLRSAAGPVSGSPLKSMMPSVSGQQATFASKGPVMEPREIMAPLLETLQKENSSLAGILAQHSSAKLKEGNLLEIYFSRGMKYFIQTLQKESRLIEKICSEIVGQKVSVKFGEETIPEDYKKEKELEAALKDPHVRHFLDTFKAQVLSVEKARRAKE